MRRVKSNSRLRGGNMEQIKVTIKKDGAIELDCNGFQGNACDITKVAEEALGMVERKDKPDFYMNEIVEDNLNME